jgi:hypothetical protein
LAVGIHGVHYIQTGYSRGHTFRTLEMDPALFTHARISSSMLACCMIPAGAYMLLHHDPEPPAVHACMHATIVNHACMLLHHDPEPMRPTAASRRLLPSPSRRSRPTPTTARPSLRRRRTTRSRRRVVCRRRRRRRRDGQAHRWSRLTSARPSRGRPTPATTTPRRSGSTSGSGWAGTRT